MTTKHTPGPWEVDQTDWPIIVNGPDLVGDGNLVSDCICTIERQRARTVYNYPTETCIANARLIASAPELLEALQRVLAWAGMYRDSLAWESGKREIEAARAAIAKATGQ